jgi:hypothetical protein
MKYSGLSALWDSTRDYNNRQAALFCEPGDSVCTWRLFSAIGAERRGSGLCLPEQDELLNFAAETE